MQQQGGASPSAGGGELPLDDEDDSTEQQPGDVNRRALLDAHEHMIGLITSQLRLSRQILLAEQGGCLHEGRRRRGKTGEPPLTRAEAQALELVLEPLQHSAAVLHGATSAEAEAAARMMLSTTSSTSMSTSMLPHIPDGRSGASFADSSVLSWPPSPPVSSVASSRPTTAAADVAAKKATQVVVVATRSVASQTTSGAPLRASLCGWLLILGGFGSFMSWSLATPVWWLLGGYQLKRLRGQLLLLWIVYIAIFHMSVALAICITLRFRCLSVSMAQALSRMWLCLKCCVPCLPTRRRRGGRHYSRRVHDVTPELLDEEGGEEVRPTSTDGCPSPLAGVKRSLLCVVFMVVIPTAGVALTNGLVLTASGLGLGMRRYPAFDFEPNTNATDSSHCSSIQTLGLPFGKRLACGGLSL